jgi:hypothetical protein
MTQYVSLIVIFVIVSANIGCSSNEEMERVPVYPAKLKLFYKGQPAKGAYVVLRPITGVSQAHPPAYGEVDADGIVKFTTYEAYDGAALGDYIITATWTEIDDDENESPDRFRGKYSTPEKSKLRCVIEKGNNDLGVINIE